MLVVGAVTEDRFGAELRTGGAVCYAARALAALGARARVLALADPEADLAALEGHDLEVVRASVAPCFEHEPAGETRRLRVLARPERPLSVDDLPAGWRDAEVLVLGPLLPDDLDVASFLSLAGRHVGLLAQGLQRAVAPDGAVSALGEPSAALVAACEARTTAFLSSEEVAPWPAGAVGELASRCARVVVTRGAAGATLHRADGEDLEVRAVPARPVDTTGGGDAFAASFMAALAVGASDAAAGAVAARVAAATVEQLGPARLPRITAGFAAGDRAVAS
jgi:sugar/nucleoside kinase (ribokinase family)